MSNMLNLGTSPLRPNEGSGCDTRARHFLGGGAKRGSVEVEDARLQP
jgi:hypothetical protein